MTPRESAQGSAGTPPATIGGPGSPWELPSSAEATQTRRHGETTHQDHVEQEEDAAEQNEPMAARHQHLRSPSPHAAAALNTSGIQRDCGAGARREGRREQREELMVTPTPHASDEAPSPRHQAYPEDVAPLRTALDPLFRRDCHLPVAHDAHAHLRLSAQATTGEMGPANAGGQENGPRDEGSRAVGALQEGANVELGADAQSSGKQATAGEMNGALAVTRTCPRAKPARAAGPRSGGGSDQQTPVEQQVRSRQGMQEEADGERDRSPRCSRGPERRGNPSVSALGAPLPQEEPTTPISQAQQAAPVAATPRSGRGSTIGYLLRTTPADVLPLSEWHAWCAELLNTALTAASIQPPCREAEFNFLIRQATLPVALGGLGLTDPTTEAAPVYLASTTEALRLLRSLDMPATAVLGSNSNALQPSAAHSVTIQDMEGRLPPLALQYLREEQETPSQDQL
ncbi:unnamed protein product [Closterium sp. NIES-64]|nr:unnamed protein product [Closterium sp. NIES-64]